MRLGWIRSDEDQILRLGRAALGRDRGPSAVEQALGLQLVRQRPFPWRVQTEEASRLRRLLVREIERRMPEWTVTGAAGEWATRVTLPGRCAHQYTQVALEFGVRVTSGPSLSPDPRFADQIFLGFGVADDAQLQEAVVALSRAWRCYGS
jgi:DNA-binding transcriptional MocR family regulator